MINIVFVEVYDDDFYKKFEPISEAELESIMKIIYRNRLYILLLFTIVFFMNCTSMTVKKNTFSLKDTLSVFLLNNEKGTFFCIPVQYLCNFHINSFEFINGAINIGEYKILLKRDEINVSVYLNKNADEEGSSDSEFNLIYSEENGKVLISKMNESLLEEQVKDDNNFIHYYIFIEKFLKHNDLKKINNEYNKGNVFSHSEIWYNLIIDNEQQNGNGMMDNFELYDGIAIDPRHFPANLNFFRVKYLQN